MCLGQTSSEGTQCARVGYKVCADDDSQALLSIRIGSHIQNTCLQLRTVPAASAHTNFLKQDMKPSCTSAGALRIAHAESPALGILWWQAMTAPRILMGSRTAHPSVQRSARCMQPQTLPHLAVQLNPANKHTLHCCIINRTGRGPFATIVIIIIR